MTLFAPQNLTNKSRKHCRHPRGRRRRRGRRGGRSGPARDCERQQIDKIVLDFGLESHPILDVEIFDSDSLFNGNDSGNDFDNNSTSEFHNDYGDYFGLVETAGSVGAAIACDTLPASFDNNSTSEFHNDYGDYFGLVETAGSVGAAITCDTLPASMDSFVGSGSLLAAVEAPVAAIACEVAPVLTVQASSAAVACATASVPVQNARLPIKKDGYNLPDAGKVPLFIYRKKLYFHQVRKLSRCNKHDSNSLSDIDKLSGAVLLSLAARTFYVAKDLHRIFHGNVEAGGKEDLHEETLALNGVPVKKITPYEGNLLLEEPTLRVAYPGSKAVDAFESLGLSHFDWLDTVLKMGACDKSRDSSDAGVLISKRIRLFWGQKQSKDYPRTLYHDGHKMPYPSFSLSLPDQLRLELGNILSVAQEYVDCFSSEVGEKKPFDDGLRNELFGIPLARSFSPNCSARGFEYVDIWVECLTSLDRHIDRKNDTRLGYNIVASYSFLIEKDGKLYRVNFIMSTRSVCGAFMDEIRTEKSSS